MLSSCSVLRRYLIARNAIAGREAYILSCGPAHRPGRKVGNSDRPAMIVIEVPPPSGVHAALAMVCRLLGWGLRERGGVGVVL